MKQQVYCIQQDAWNSRQMITQLTKLVAEQARTIKKLSYDVRIMGNIIKKNDAEKRKFQQNKKRRAEEKRQQLILQQREAVIRKDRASLIIQGVFEKYKHTAEVLIRCLGMAQKQHQFVFWNQGKKNLWIVDRQP